MNILELKHAKKSFDGVEVLKDIDLSVSEGQVVSIIGPSGSGKSTLLRCVTFLETLDDGSLSYQGQEVVHSENGRAVYGNKAQIKQAMGSFGLVFQNFNLFPHFSVLKKYHGCTDPCAKASKRAGGGRGTGTAEKDGACGSRRCISLPVVRRAATARFHCACAGTQTGDPLF